MPTWLIVTDETFTPDGAADPQRQVTVRPLSGNKLREEAQQELLNYARRYVPASWKNRSRTVGRAADGSFWIVAKHPTLKASCHLTLIEQIPHS
ncbi:hypothetical protein ACWEPM_30090 [Streptomyces sp. NPDC004244]